MAFVQRPQLVVFFGSFAFSTMVIQYFLAGLPVVTDLYTFWSNCLTTTEWFAIVLGTVSVMQRNTRNIRKRRREWFIDVGSIAVVLTMSITYYAYGTGHIVFVILNQQVRSIANTAVFALHGFLVFSALFRGFKATSPIKLISMLAMFVFMLYQVPIGDAIWPGIMPLGEWISEVVLSAGTRAIITGSAVGMIVLGVRVLLGKEVQTYGVEGGD